MAISLPIPGEPRARSSANSHLPVGRTVVGMKNAAHPGGRQPSRGGDSPRRWLDVPFAEKDEAKAHGARWDPNARSWYAPDDRSNDLVKWMPLPNLLPGEHRDFGSGLFVDLVPSSCWFTNVRSCVTPRDWDRLRLMIYRRAGHRCEACGGERNNAAGVYLEAHERWSYVAGHVQVLTRLICLCTPCHEVTHFGFATLRQRDIEAMDHLMKVNSWSHRQAQDHIDNAFRLWRTRSASDWTLDVSMLTAVGIAVTQPPAPEDRRRATAEILLGAGDPPSAPSPPPGWYDDPSGSHRWRWWDGNRWTQHAS
jgi:hypothetical protein